MAEVDMVVAAAADSVADHMAGDTVSGAGDGDVSLRS